MSEEISPKLGPNPSDAPVVEQENTKTFSYDVASQVKTDSSVKPNPNSPLAAG
jgi:hypothetical protein